MKIRFGLVSILVSGILLSQLSLAVEEKKHFVWPKGIKAAVSLSYDDSLNSQLDNAVPALNKYDLKASFYLQLGADTITKRLPEWRAVAEKGHELANHTLFHQCSAGMPDRGWVQPQRDLDKTTVAALKDQIVVGNAFLYAIDGKTERTFTSPCGDLLAAGQNYLPSIKSEFVAIKSKFGGVAQDMATLDPYDVGVYMPTNVTGKQLIQVVEEAVAKGTMANFTFHGINGDYLSVSKEAHEELLAYLAKHKDTIWTDRFIDIMKYVKTQQAQLNTK